MLHHDPQHVSSSTLLIIRRTDCITKASGIVTMETLISTLLYIYPCSVNSDDFMFLLLNDLSREHLTTLDITEFKWLPAYLSSWGWAGCCSKRVEDRNV